jgi:hypothetical protein
MAQEIRNRNIDPCAIPGGAEGSPGAQPVDDRFGLVFEFVLEAI